jgi:hypothetical protein
MKFWVLIVCVLNVLFFFWEFHNGAFTSQPQQQANLPTILLAEEAERAQRGVQISAYLDKDAQLIVRQQVGSAVAQLVAQTEPVNSKPNALEAQACYEFGPFSSQKAAKAWLAEQGISGRLFYKPELVPSTYMLYAPLEKDPQKRRLYKQMLIDKGVTDFFIFANGELKGQMSFGVFNDMPHASRHQQQLAERGIQVQIKERYITRSSLFVGYSRRQTGNKVATGVLEVDCKD